MKIEFVVKFDDESLGVVRFEKPPGAHPESQACIATAFIEADKQGNGKTAIAIRRKAFGAWGSWITRKDSVSAILAERDKRITEEKSQ